MKTKIMRTGWIAALALLIMAMAGSCKKEEMNTPTSEAGRSSSTISDDRTTNMGSAAVQMTATGSNFYKAVNIEITGVAFQFEEDKFGNGGWVNFPVLPKIYNLLNFQGEMALRLASFNRLPYGRVMTMRITLGKNNSVVWLDAEGLRHWAALSTSGLDRVIMLPMKGTYVYRGSTTIVSTQFNTAASISREDNDIFILKPVVSVTGVDHEK